MAAVIGVRSHGDAQCTVYGMVPGSLRTADFPTERPGLPVFRTSSEAATIVTQDRTNSLALVPGDSMTVSRLRLRLLWLTLIAFGVQIVVTDFHHHVSRGTGLEARALTAGMCRPSQERPCTPDQKDHDGCVLCWAMSVAATSLTPALFHLPHPSVLVADRLSSPEQRQIRIAHLADVRARGPPRSIAG
jgi:hypothetical protein